MHSIKMNTITIIILGIIVLGVIVWLMTTKYGQTSLTQENPTSIKTLEDLLNELESLGFYKYTTSEIASKNKAEVLATGNIFGDEETKRLWHADAEDLAEGGVKQFLEEMMPFLQTLNVSIASIQEDFNIDGAYNITINGIKYSLYSEAELKSEDIWDLTSKRTFIILNKLLAQAGSSERVYQLYGGNDQFVVVLTAEMYEAIHKSQILAERDMPIPIE